jgi:hypothetical protein
MCTAFIMSSKEKIKFKPGTILTQAASFSLMMLCDSFLPAVDVRQFFKTSMITQKNMRQ